MDPVRIGCLGAARITPFALLRPARRVDGAEAVAVAARDPHRAATFARRHGIPRVLPSYDALLADPGIDAVYIALPAALHAPWALRALAAGKHVLCEKPFAVDADAAAEVASAAEAAGLVAMEAMHPCHHPLWERMLAIVAGGELGTVRHVEAALAVCVPQRHDIRWDPALGGGAMMDAGVYAARTVLDLAGAEPEVVAATARERVPGVDRWTRAELRFPSGATGSLTASLWSPVPLRASARVVGDDGTLHAVNPVLPQLGHWLTTTRAGATRREHVHGRGTYHHQLVAFVDAVRTGTPARTSAAAAVATMRLVDAVYRAAGLPPRRDGARTVPA